jgi:hypothetical protein
MWQDASSTQGIFFKLQVMQSPAQPGAVHARRVHDQWGEGLRRSRYPSPCADDPDDGRPN